MADEEPADKVTLQFHYIKGPDYRETACHGAFGGLTPQRKLWMAFYAERYPLPRLVEYKVPSPPPGSNTVDFNEATAVPDSIESRQGCIRHVEFGTYMDIEIAERVRDWLTKQIDQAKATQAQTETK
jgi:hypothetical protein